MIPPLVASALFLSGCAAAPAARPAAPSAPPPGMQFLYGSAEAAALSRQAYNALVDHVRALLDARRRHDIAAPLSVVLAPDAAPEAPRFVDCGDKPPAVLLDIDETALLNLGYEDGDARSGAPYDDARWQRWERTGAEAVAAVPGAAEAFAAVRAMGVTVILSSNRRAAFAAQTERALAFAGLGAFRSGDTLLLRGAADASTKDGRRAAVAARFCVLAMAGDQLGDFSDRFTGAGAARRALASRPAVAALWGRGWFVLPNPVYGSGLGGSFDEVFPADRRWIDPGPQGGR